MKLRYDGPFVIDEVDENWTGQETVFKCPICVKKEKRYQ